MTVETKTPPEFAKAYPNLASPRFGTLVEAASDEFFAAKERMILDAPPVFVPDKYDEHGKWMDGWESRRRRDGGHDWCVLRLGVASRLYGVNIDTSHFTGNYPPGASLQACFKGDDPQAHDSWREILPRQSLGPDQPHFFPIDCEQPVIALRLNIFPDGGVARLRVYGEAAPDWADAASEQSVELSALKNGGRILAYNNAHYGDVWALLSEGRGRTMGDGWETRRRREPGHDWMIIALGAAGRVDHIEIDTAHFKGNFPESASIEGAKLERAAEKNIINQAMFWQEILPRQKLSADAIHEFSGDVIKDIGPITHIKLNIFPDGGVSRLRIKGRRV